MTDLTELRDHARKMAALTEVERPSSIAIGCNPYITPPTALHGCVEDPEVGCGCECHDPARRPLPSDSDRALWTQIADEIDAHLAPVDEGPGLFGDTP